MESYIDGVWFARELLQKGLAALYLVAFVSAWNQFPALLGERGLLPVPSFLARTSFRDAPSLFHFHYSDRLFRFAAGSGIALALAAASGISERGPVWLSAGVWLVLFLLYLSIVNVGQTFYGFGWESMLLEAGFFAVFLGPSGVEASPIPILALRWMLFRTEVGAGLIKLRHDRCWRDLTCLYYHYETQPLPNPLSWHFHHLPKWVHRGGVAFSHVVQVVAPFGLFLPQPLAAGAGLLIIAHQLLLIVSGNYSWLNWLTVLLGVTAFDDAVLQSWFSLEAPATAPRGTVHELVLYALAVATLALSVKPALNLISRHQRMNYNYNPLHIVNAYGAFGSVTRERIEIVVEGTDDPDGGEWKEYGFRAKPGDPARTPPQIAPYHLRLDWMMWFLPLRGMYRPEAWFVRMLDKLLAGERAIAKLLRHNPFPHRPPRAIRALVYSYEFTSRRERAETGAWWKRELVGEYTMRERTSAREPAHSV